MKNIDYKDVFEHFEKLCDNNFSRLGQTFKTEKNKYFYDSGTGKVFMCENIEYDILDTLINTSDIISLNNLKYSNNEIIASLTELYNLEISEHVFKLPYYKKFINNNQNEKKEISQLILEVTQQCNLRCKYCVYGDDCSYFRKFNTTHMSWDTAKKIIDYAIKNSGNELHIGFYGGEPFLNFNLIKQCIEYCKTFNNKCFHFSFTSNLTLITKEIAKYLSNMDSVNILCSIDGPKKYHDQYRCYPNGKGSFNDTLAGLNNLVSVFKERCKDVISINSVICPPYDKKKLEEIKIFFEDENIFPKGIKFRYSYVSYGSLKNIGIDDVKNFNDDSIKRFYSQDLQNNDPIKAWALNNLCNKSNIEYEKNIENFNLLKMQNRPLSDYPIPTLNRNGCCTPGYGRLYVTSEGKFKVCEKIGESPFFGDVENGICEKCIQKKFIDEYDVNSLKNCNQCWAVHLCDVCYSTSYDKKGFNTTKKEKTCIHTRANIKNNLIEYYQILETKPDLIDDLTVLSINTFNE